MKHVTHAVDFRVLLRKNGSKATPARISVLEILKKSRRPISAQDVIDALKKGMDQATVYRILKVLKIKGLIRQVDLRHNHAHYEIMSEYEHHHLVCMCCGRIEDVHDCGVEETHEEILRRARHFAEIKQHALEFYGVCKACVKR